MATAQENLIQARDRAIAAYNALVIAPRPDGGLDGEVYQWSKMRNDLLMEIKELNMAILALEGPFESSVYPFGA